MSGAVELAAAESVAIMVVVRGNAVNDKSSDSRSKRRSHVIMLHSHCLYRLPRNHSSIKTSPPIKPSVCFRCMDMPTCEQEWWNATSPKAECQVVDPTTPATLDCTFCCQGDGCNKDTKPVDTTLLQFNP